ncbi:MAG TPA: RNA-binding transcriptional accessory protein [Candidatus Anaerofilum excrementigallinarum]|nr:RNA-binding transcriptional accessory protein [Candidatus Anaerofilum excrementigallinarum]
MTDHIKILAAELNQPADRVKAAVELIDAGNTIPFIARYRKEATGSMDDQVLRQLADRLEYLRGLDDRRAAVKEAIEAQGALTDALAAALDKAATLAELEDLYRPYKPKRKTRASMAKARGLEPLAERLLRQQTGDDPLALAADYIGEEVPDAEAALAGARDIIAEMASDNASLRARLRTLYESTGLIVSKAAKEEDSVYSSYYDFSQSAAKIAGHRVLALDRGEREGFLKVSVEVDEAKALDACLRHFLRGQSPSAAQVKLAVEDGYSRLIQPSLERELRAALTQKAAEGAIQVFGENLRQLLLAPPIKGKVAMGLDPGYRMGCKVAVVDATGKVLDTAVVYPVPEFKRVDAAKRTIKEMIRRHKVEIIAIGNGTAGRETELFAAEVIREMDMPVSYMVVSEAGASVYSASKLAAEEFPEYDVNLRSAVSIARRLQDPLAELVKIDPKAVGVGQYQHDMPPARLAAALDGVVEDCVNTVGVDLNTASAPLLERVAGLTKTTAKNIVKYREESGEFASRRQLLKVKGVGPKAFEQCAGFLRLPGAADPLDATAVHPESYAAAHALLDACGYTPADIGTEAIRQLPQRVKEAGEKTVADRIGVGLPTLRDIEAELLRPGRDMRDELPPPLLRTDVMKLEDLKPGMQLQGTVRNVIDFGAFVDIGVHQDGLVHISQLCDRFVRHPGEVVKVGDVVTVWVMQVDVAKKRISLTMKQPK